MDESKHALSDLMGVTMSKIREMVDVNTIIGDAISLPDGTSIIPVSKVAFGFGCGGGDYQTKASTSQNFGGGSGAGITIMPIAFLIVSGGNVKLLPVTEPANTTVDRLVEMVPDVIEKVSEYIQKRKDSKSGDEIFG